LRWEVEIRDRSWWGPFWKTKILGGSVNSETGEFLLNERPIGHAEPFSRLSQLSAQTHPEVEALPENLGIT
jgi:hypothetical protein